MKTREDNPKDWFMLGEDRLRGADILYAAGGVTYLGVEALHEAVERYLKGFLVSRGWRIERTHDLSYLIDCAIGHDEAFKQYAGLAESLSDQFWAQHYPGGNLDGFGIGYDALRKQAGELVGLIVKSVS
jgi:HEPN domain-containing protein